VGEVALMGNVRSAYKILTGKREWKRPLGRTTCRWEDKIKMNINAIV
jgi:hypothetical protein